MTARSESGGLASTDIDRADTERRVTQILVEHLGVEEADVGPHALLVPEHDAQSRKIEPSEYVDLGADSLDVVEIVMVVEDEFQIEIADDESEPLNKATVAQLIDLVHAKRLEEAANA
jgi:acyl carrier protein